MPPKVQLHSNKGRAKSFPKSVVPVASTDESASTSDDRQFEVELCWCVQKLEANLQNKNVPPKIAQESLKILNVLKSTSQPKVRKRQVMRMHFGDYRSKMAAEEKKADKVAKVKVESGTTKSTNSTFVKKSSHLTQSENQFRFNFDIKLDDVNSPPNEAADLTPIQNVGIARDQPSKQLSFNGNDFKFNFQIDDCS